MNSSRKDFGECFLYIYICLHIHSILQVRDERYNSLSPIFLNS